MNARRVIALLALIAAITLASGASASGHATAWKPDGLLWTWHHQSYRVDSGCEAQDVSSPPTTAWKSEEMTITGSRWVLDRYSAIVYSGRYGGPNQPAGGGHTTLQRRLTQVFENCSDRSQFVRTCTDSVPSRKPEIPRTYAKTRRVRFYIELNDPEYLRCRTTDATPPGFYVDRQETPSVFLPLSAFYGARTQIVLPERRYSSTGNEIDPATNRPYTVQGTVSFSLRFGLRRYVERRAACRDRRPQHHFVCTYRDHPRGVGTT